LENMTLRGLCSCTPSLSGHQNEIFYCFVAIRFVLCSTSFLNSASSDNGWKLHAEIPHPDTIAEHPELSLATFSCQEADCVMYHQSRASYLRHQFLCWIESAETRNCSAILGQHFRYGSPDTPEYKDHLRRCGISSLFPTPTYRVEEGSFSLEDGYLIFAESEAGSF
jgi:hypothetical protein